MNECVYCGGTADTKDHVVPRAFMRAIEDAVPPLERPKQQLVDACRRCNSILGAKVFPSFEARRDWIRGELLRRGEAIADVLDPPQRRQRLSAAERPAPKRAPAVEYAPMPLSYYARPLHVIGWAFGSRPFTTREFRQLTNRKWDGHALRALEVRGALDRAGETWRLSEHGQELLAGLHVVQHGAS